MAENKAPQYPFYLAGEWRERADGAGHAEVRSPYSGEVLGVAHIAGAEELEQATQAAVRALETTRRMPAHRRASILRQVSDTIRERAEEFARLVASEAGKPLKQARAEVQRSIVTFAQAAEEASRIEGEVLSLDAAPGGEGRQGIVRRFPIGPVAAITPFNFPLNLVAHKLAPAIAAGCPVVLKPAPATPLTALRLAAVIHEAGWPAGALSVLPLEVADAAPLVEDERFKLLSFTGSAAVGWHLKARAGRKRVVLELGGNAPVIIHRDADLERAIARLEPGGFSYAGQSCISVQRIYVHSAVYHEFLNLLLPRVQALTVGDPLDENTDLSALINLQAAERVAAWLDEARAAGAQIITGGGVRGSIVEPTVITGAGPDLQVNCNEIFAPVVTVQPYDAFADALAAANTSDYGLQAGVFTNRIDLAWQAYDALEVGGVLINDVPTWRVDHMPYGGIKQSGFGREGLKYAIEEMTEPRLLVFNL
jgi:glyceraldehyde-3-phosphate dehydrogenase (NADP+)